MQVSAVSLLKKFLCLPAIFISLLPIRGIPQAVYAGRKDKPTYGWGNRNSQVLRLYSTYLHTK